MPELSVLLPARNAEGTIRRAVRSTLSAMPRDAELVVLDDGSCDSTLDILQALISDSRLRVLQAGEQSGRGVGHALEFLLASTDSRFVARMDADDISLPARFSQGLPVVRDSADLVFSTFIKLIGRRPVPGIPLSISSSVFGLHLLLTNPVCHPTLIARRAVLERVGGYREVPSEDYDLWLRCANDGASLTRLALHGLVYRIHPSQVTASRDWRAASWSSHHQAEAFGDLSERMVGVRLRRLVQIATLPDEAERLSAIREFESVLSPAVSRITGVQGLFLRRRLASRLDWARLHGLGIENQRGKGESR